MSGEAQPIASRRGAGTLRRAALPAVWALGALAVVLGGLQEDGYLTHVRGIPPPHPYPSALVALLLLAMAVEAWLLAAVLRPATYANSWGRALVASGVAFAFLFFAAFFSMHQPPSWTWYVLWAAVVAVATVLLAIASAIRTLVQRSHRNDANEEAP